MNVEEFYKKCEEILGTKTNYKKQNLYVKVDRNTGKTYKVPTKATRWGGREPGNGRFLDHGLIRVFGKKIHVSLNNPPLNDIFDSFESALKALRKAVGAVKKSSKIGDDINVYIMGEFVGRGIIVQDHNTQWCVMVTIIHPNGYEEKTKRYIYKKDE